MLPKRMQDLDAVAYYARYIKIVKGLPCRPLVYAARPNDLSSLLTTLELGPNERLVRGGDDLKPDMALITKSLLICVT